MRPSPPDIREIRDLALAREVVRVQHEVWGDIETVPASLLLVSAKRGGILLGAFDVDRLLGFVWSMPSFREGRPAQWSHMLGVRPDARGGDLGAALKRAQRDRALAQGLDLVEWTVDPLQAQNAHLNMRRLGGIAALYWPDVYGASESSLHKGTPTDRLVIEWWLARPHVERRLSDRTLDVRSAELLDAPSALSIGRDGPWTTCVTSRLDIRLRRLVVPIPPAFTEMQRQAPDLALAWRLGCRETFQNYFGLGYRAVDFFLDRDAGGGQYLLALPE